MRERVATNFSVMYSYELVEQHPMEADDDRSWGVRTRGLSEWRRCAEYSLGRMNALHLPVVCSKRLRDGQ